MDPEMTEDYMFLQSVIDVTFEAIEKLQIFFQNRETVMQCALLTMSMSDYNMFNAYVDSFIRHIENARHCVRQFSSTNSDDINCDLWNQCVDVLLTLHSIMFKLNHYLIIFI